MPKNVVRFERLMYGSFVLGLIVMVMTSHQLFPTAGAGFVIARFLIQLMLMATFCLFI